MSKFVREVKRLRLQLASRGFGHHEAALRELLPHLIKRKLRLTVGERISRMPRVRFVHSDGIPYTADCIIRREGGGYTFLLPYQSTVRTTGMVVDYGSAYLWWLTNCPDAVTEMTVTVSDGNYASRARFAPSSNRDDIVAIPDPYFCNTGGFAGWREKSDVAHCDWAQRSASVVWAGAGTGMGTFDPDLAAACPKRIAQRLRLCLALREVPDAQGRLYYVEPGDITMEVLRRHGLATGFMPEEDWMFRKFAVDIDGHTNTWSNLLVRFHLGCCVLKVDSQHGYRQWYYDRIRPWEHFIPVRADLSDLAEKIDWARSNDVRSREIAGNGRAFARTLTYEAFMEPGQGSDHGGYGS
jgi:hypothetical protein